MVRARACTTRISTAGTDTARTAFERAACWSAVRTVRHQEGSRDCPLDRQPEVARLPPLNRHKRRAVKYREARSTDGHFSVFYLNIEQPQRTMQLKNE